MSKLSGEGYVNDFLKKYIQKFEREDVGLWSTVGKPFIARGNPDLMLIEQAHKQRLEYLNRLNTSNNKHHKKKKRTNHHGEVEPSRRITWNNTTILDNSHQFLMNNNNNNNNNPRNNTNNNNKKGNKHSSFKNYTLNKSSNGDWTCSLDGFLSGKSGNHLSNDSSDDFNQRLDEAIKRLERHKQSKLQQNNKVTHRFPLLYLMQSEMRYRQIRNGTPYAMLIERDSQEAGPLFGALEIPENVHHSPHHGHYPSPSTHSSRNNVGRRNQQPRSLYNSNTHSHPSSSMYHYQNHTNNDDDQSSEKMYSTHPPASSTNHHHRNPLGIVAGLPGVTNQPRPPNPNTTTHNLLVSLLNSKNMKRGSNGSTNSSSSSNMNSSSDSGTVIGGLAGVSSAKDSIHESKKHSSKTNRGRHNKSGNKKRKKKKKSRKSDNNKGTTEMVITGDEPRRWKENFNRVNEENHEKLLQKLATNTQDRFLVYQKPKLLASVADIATHPLDYTHLFDNEPSLWFKAKYTHETRQGLVINYRQRTGSAHRSPNGSSGGNSESDSHTSRIKAMEECRTFWKSLLVYIEVDITPLSGLHQKEHLVDLLLDLKQYWETGHWTSVSVQVLEYCIEFTREHEIDVTKDNDFLKLLLFIKNYLKISDTDFKNMFQE